MNRKYAQTEKSNDNIETVIGLKEALEEFMDSVKENVNPFSETFTSEINELPWESYDGFRAHNHNRGGLDFISIDSIDRLVGSGDHMGLKISEWVNDQYDETYKNVVTENPTLKTDSNDFYEALDSSFCSEYDTVAFRVRAMYEGEGLLVVHIGYDKDAPYFRWSEKSHQEIEIKFKTIAGLKRKLKALIKKIEV